MRVAEPSVLIRITPFLRAFSNLADDGHPSATDALK